MCLAQTAKEDDVSKINVSWKYSSVALQ